MRTFQMLRVVGLAVVVCLMVAGNALAQVTLDPAWPENPKTFGGEGLWDSASCVQQTTDGGYIVAGATSSWGAGQSDIHLIKLDAQGNLDPAWGPNPKTFGGELDDWAYSVQQTADGGYVVVGVTNSFGAGNSDVYVLKVDSKGVLDTTWDRNPQTYGSPDFDYGYSVQLTADGGYIVAGEGRFFGYDIIGDAFLLKLDAKGDLDPAWDPNPKVFAGDGLTSYSARCIQRTQDNGYIVAGTAQGSGVWDVFLIKLDATGDLDPTWNPNPKTFGGEDLKTVYFVRQTNDGGYIVVGKTKSSDFIDDNDALAVKFDSEGNLDPAWKVNPVILGGDADDRLWTAQQTRDGGCLLAGGTRSFGAGSLDAWLIKLDSQGSLDASWDPNPRTFGGQGPDRASALEKTRDGGYVIVGYTGPIDNPSVDALLLKLAPARRFLRGDCNGDGLLNGVPDAVTLLEYAVFGGGEPPCIAACDADGNGEAADGVTDVLYLLQYFFLGNAEPVAPFPECGAGQLWTDGPLTCETEPECP